MIADPRRARSSLALLFYGVPFVVVDVRWRVDLVPDAVGLVLLAVGLIGLLSQTTDTEAVRWLRAAAVVAVVAVPVSMLAEFDVPVHAFWRLSEIALELAWLVLTCVGMEELTRAVALPESHRLWTRTRQVAVACVAGSLGVMLLVPFGGVFVAVVAALLLGLAAIGTFLLATLRTRAEIAAA